MYHVTLWHALVTFIPSQLSSQPDTISVKLRTCTVIYCSQQKEKRKKILHLPIFLSDFKQAWISDRFSQMSSISNLMETYPVVVALKRAEG